MPEQPTLTTPAWFTLHRYLKEHPDEAKAFAEAWPDDARWNSTAMQLLHRSHALHPSLLLEALKAAGLHPKKT